MSFSRRSSCKKIHFEDESNVDKHHDWAEIYLWIDFAWKNNSDDEQISLSSMRKKEESVYAAWERKKKKDKIFE